MIKLLRVVPGLLLMAVLTACTLQPTRSAPDSGPAAALAVTDTSDPEDFGPAADETGPQPSQFSRENLLLLLTAELAAKRQDYDTVLANYLKVAHATRDEGVVTRAYSAAQFLKNDAAMTDMVLLWSEIAPDNVDVQHQAAFELIKARRLPEALARMEKVLELEGPTAFDRVALQAKSLNAEEKAEMLRLYEDILARYPDNAELKYGYAVLQEINEQTEGALKTTAELLETSPTNPAVITMHARLLKNTAGAETAIDFLRAREDLLLADPQLGNFYARALIDDQRLGDAQQIYRVLSERHPEAYHLRLSYALVAFENGDLALARQELEKLIDANQHVNDVQFYLGRLAEQESRQRDAIAHYDQVERGGHFFSALGRAAYLLANDEDMDGALKRFTEARRRNPSQGSQIWELQINLLVELDRLPLALEAANQAIEQYPESNALLYARAMLRDRLGDFPGMESDLRSILESEPDNAVTLNALGYTLADRNLRLDEARSLIARALALDPDNPAIMDSMGWVLFRLQQPTEALTYLERAYAVFPDPEVGAHLGEVLWTLGQREAALKVFRDNVARDARHRVLTETLQRLGLEDLLDQD